MMLASISQDKAKSPHLRIKCQRLLGQITSTWLIEFLNLTLFKTQNSKASHSPCLNVNKNFVNRPSCWFLGGFLLSLLLLLDRLFRPSLWAKSNLPGERDSNLVWQGIIIILQVPAATLNGLIHKSLMKRLGVRVCNLCLLSHRIQPAGIPRRITTPTLKLFFYPT